MTSPKAGEISELALTPVADDPRDLGSTNGVRTWRAHSADPAFIATRTDGHAFQAGWHVATAAIEPRSGSVTRPSLYLPGPSGEFSEERRVMLERDGATWTARLHLDRPAQQVRFDPSEDPCEFSCSLRIQWARAWQVPPAEHLARMPLIGSLLRPQAKSGAVPPPTGSARPPDRKERVLATLDRRGVGIEIGPSHDPIAPKSEGFRVHVIDHASREELRAKYAGHNVELDRIEEVDFVWRGESYAELTGRRDHYDWVIASHAIEHTPDLVAFLADCDAVLKDSGVLSLVIPDKRYEFDRFRPVTSLAAVVDAHLAGRKAPSPGSVAEHHLYAVGKAHTIAWYPGAPGAYTLIHSDDDTRRRVRETVDKTVHHDVHNWCFVPHAFRLLVEDLHTLGYTRLREVSFHPTEGGEFYVTLGRTGTGPGIARLNMLRLIDAESASVVGD
jgi:hypothetical protein